MAEPPPAHLGDRLMRVVLTAAHRWWAKRRSASGARGPGAHAIALTPAGRVILVKLRYAPGWRLPGGGRNAGESVEAAALRELGEEIGMIGHGRVAARPDIDPAIALIEDVTYRARRWSWEIEAVAEAEPDALPGDLSPLAIVWLQALRAAPRER